MKLNFKIKKNSSENFRFHLWFRKADNKAKIDEEKKLFQNRSVIENGTCV